MSTEEIKDNSSQGLEGGTYEILRDRLRNTGDDLRARLLKLNDERKEVFGAIETTLIATERISTSNNCVARDMVPVGGKFLFGYNVLLGLKSETKLADVFSTYGYEKDEFKQLDLSVIQDKRFVEDFANLYQYYKDTVFTRFMEIGPYIYMVFKVGKDITDIKAFKWTVNQDGTLGYVDARSEHEVVYPSQHEFEWTKTAREMFREGKHPHVSIEDMVFVETVGGDLTIKVEDNTADGLGIYREPVENKDQTLDDGEIYYAVLENLILLKIRPYQEELYRYLVYNIKQQEVTRIDKIEDAAVLLPDDHGIIFSNGYYLQTGEYKLFDNDLKNMMFERRITSPNGEDTLFIFYNRHQGLYLLLPYNLINQSVATPIICHGYSFFENGELIYFRTDEEPTKHHAVQVWQTPYVGPNYVLPTTSNSYLFKVGNKDVVKAMAEMGEILTLIQKEDSFAGLYLDLIRFSTDVLDSYYWLDKDEAYHLDEPLQQIRDTAKTAVDEFEKVRRIRKNTEEAVLDITSQAQKVIDRARVERPSQLIGYVELLAELRRVRGEVVSLRELRYVDTEKVDRYDEDLEKFTQTTSRDTVNFLMLDNALDPYREKIQEQETKIGGLEKVIDAGKLEEEIRGSSGELEMLIEVVSNLEIEDATQTTRIIDNISTVYASYNQIRAALKQQRQKLLIQEGAAEFTAQIKLVDQGVANYLDVADSPEKVDEYLTKLMVQLEELEGKFSEFDDYVDKIGQKREELYNAFESQKLSLIETRNKRATTLQQSADRILKAVKSRLNRMTEVTEINGYYASDLMIEKVRKIVENLAELGDSVKADSIQSSLKNLKEDAIRQLKDKQELFVEGSDLINFGKFQFSVNNQPLDLTIVHRDEGMFYHLTGTGFFEAITDSRFNECQPVWEQSYVSENTDIYRSEYLAFHLLEKAKNADPLNEEDATLDRLSQMADVELLRHVQRFMSTQYNEGYVKGVHDEDATLLARHLTKLHLKAGLLRYTPEVRAVATYYWHQHASDQTKDSLHDRLKGVGSILQIFPDTHEFDSLIGEVQEYIRAFIQETGLFGEHHTEQAGEYLFHQISQSDQFVIDSAAVALHTSFLEYIRAQRAKKSYEDSIAALDDQPQHRFELIRHWLRAYLSHSGAREQDAYLDEATWLLFEGKYTASAVSNVSLEEKLTGLRGSHRLIDEGAYRLHYHLYMGKLYDYVHNTVKMFRDFSSRKKKLIQETAQGMRLEEFKPRVLSSFVRNKLIDEVYLPLIGTNLAKQIGAAGENKRTDLMGMLLLISPPGYGKTTLMEYIASRLGIIFMKINGPAIGHQVTSIDPADASNSAAKEELQKLNLAFEMGDNVMIYLDDIQHCNPEFLQKFISLCDAQRKIEGVYKGRTKTYDFRGKKVAVVMAGNPYTESGDKFQIPDMLANRADIYNLGDIIGGADSAFELSYIENCLTANPVLAKLAAKSPKDVHAMLRIAETGNSEGANFEANHGPEEVNEYVSVLKKLFTVRDIVLQVNQAYIASAAQQDEYRTEPPFKLQGSYRNMSKMAEKIATIMNDQELETLILSHYENEAQTLTTGAEANVLKFKELYGVISEKEKARWLTIQTGFQKQQRAKGFGQNQIAPVIEQMELLNTSLSIIGEALGKQ